MVQKKAKKILIIITQNDFQDEEYERIRGKLESAGFEVDVGSQTRQIADGEFGLKVKPDVSLLNVDPSLYKGVVFIGGPGIEKFWDDVLIKSLAQTFDFTKKWTTAICKAAIILARAGVLKGIKATCLPEDRNEVEQGEGKYLDTEIVFDKHILTARDTEDADKFGTKLIKTLKSQQAKED